jgi:outer membrane usher protein
MVRQPEDRMKFEAAGMVGVMLAARVSLSLQEVVSETHAGTSVSDTSLIGSVRVTRKINVFLNASRATRAGAVHTSVYAGAGVALGAATSASVWGQSGSIGSGASAEVQRSLPVGNGIGYRARAALGGTSQAEGMIEAQGPYGRYEAGQEVIDGRSNTRASAAGGLVFIGGGVHTTRPVNESYALVRVPDVAGVRAYLNNQETGRTNRRGDTLISNLLPYYANRIGISDQDVPLDRDIETVEQAVAPPYHGGALVVFQANRRQCVTGTVVVRIDSQSVIPALGELTVFVGGQSISSPIGTSGEFYLENIPAGRHDGIVVFKGGRCRVTLDVPTSTAAVIRLGVVRGGTPEGE